MQEGAMQINVSDKVGLLLRTLSKLTNMTSDEIILKALKLDSLDLGEPSVPPPPAAPGADGIFRTREAPLSVGLRLRKVFKGQERHAAVSQEGICVEGVGGVFQSPSKAAVAVTGYNTNGWTFWDYWDEASQDWKPLDSLRNQSMTAYERLDIYILERAKAAPPNEGFLFRFVELANMFGIDQALVRQRLERRHREEYIRLSGFDEYNRLKPFDQWRNEETFWYTNTDGGARRIHLTDKGDELLERLAT